MRRVCIVSYDIADPKRLRQVYRTMRGFGAHLQLSVFTCDLTGAQRIAMVAALENAIDRDEDQILLIDLGPSQARPIHQIEALGRPLTVRDRGPVVL
jgi:CRISPR-associated protein Cas2